MKHEATIAILFSMSYRAAYMDGGLGGIRLGESVVLGDDLLRVAKKQNAEVAKVFALRYFVIDLLAVNDFQVLPDDIYQLAAFNATMSPYFAREPLVLILAGNKLGVAISRFWQTVSSELPWRVQLERTKQNALEWFRTVWIPEVGDTLETYPDLVNYLKGSPVELEFLDGEEHL